LHCGKHSGYSFRPEKIGCLVCAEGRAKEKLLGLRSSFGFGLHRVETASDLITEKAA
jgi:hypothetical protein